MRVLLLNAPVLFARELTRPPFSTHLQLLYSVLRAHGADVRVIDPMVELGLPGGDMPGYEVGMRALLDGASFDVAGVSCWTSFQYAGAMLAGRMLRELAPSAPVAVGGWHPTAVPADFLGQDSPFDQVVRGAGELALLDLCEKPERPNAPIVVNGRSLPLRDLNYDWTYPYHCGGLFLSRGCPHACLYCAERPDATDICDLDHAVEQYARAATSSLDGFVHVHDACFGLKRCWRRPFLRRIASLRLRPRLDVEMRIDQLEREDIELLAANRAVVFFGVESGSPEMLRIMNKTTAPGAYLTRCRSTLAACDELGVPYWLSVMVGHPGETRTTIEESVEFFWRLLWDGPSESLISLALHRYTYWPGSRVDGRLAELEERFGTRIHHPGWWREPSAVQSELAEKVTPSRDLGEGDIEHAMQRLAVAQWLHRARHGPAPVPNRDDVIANAGRRR